MTVTYVPPARTTSMAACARSARKVRWQGGLLQPRLGPAMHWTATCHCHALTRGSVPEGLVPGAGWALPGVHTLRPRQSANSAALSLGPLPAPCPGADCLGGNQLESLADYWRSSNTSVRFYACRVAGGSGIFFFSADALLPHWDTLLPDSFPTARCLRGICVYMARPAASSQPSLPDAAGVCKEGPATGDAACEPGQMGPLCDVCKPDWFKFSGTCK